jgi:oligopeptidase B
LDWQGISKITDLKIHESGGTRHFVKSKDGTNVPYIIIRGNRPIRGLFVIGYGAYGLPTHINTERWLPLLRRGYTLCYALVRGGGDHDDAWAEAARRDHKVKSVEDFEAVIQSAQKKTDVNPENTMIYGRSAGGYLVGATLARNATGNLFGSLYTEVPYLDVLSTTSNPTLPLTQLEYEEFGDPLHKKKDRAAILRLSPVNTIPESGAPAIFVLCRTGLNDKEVFAYESVKWITRLREIEGKPKLLAISEGEGHFVSGRSSFRERAEDLALLLSSVARRFSTDQTKKSKHRIYKMALSRRNRKNNMISRKNRKNNMMGGRNRKNNMMSRRNNMMGGRKRRGSRRNRKNNM